MGQYGFYLRKSAIDENRIETLVEYVLWKAKRNWLFVHGIHSNDKQNQSLIT